jgi:hypothetical protein
MLRIWNRRLWYEVDARDGIRSRRKARLLTAIFARIPDAANSRGDVPIPRPVSAPMPLGFDKDNKQNARYAPQDRSTNVDAQRSVTAPASPPDMRSASGSSAS